MPFPDFTFDGRVNVRVELVHCKVVNWHTGEYQITRGKRETLFRTRLWATMRDFCEKLDEFDEQLDVAFRQHRPADGKAVRVLMGGVEVDGRLGRCQYRLCPNLIAWLPGTQGRLSDYCGPKCRQREAWEVRKAKLAATAE